MNTHRRSFVRRASLLVAVLVSAAAGAVALYPHSAEAGAGAAPPDGVSGCPITVTVKNTSKQSFVVNWDQSQVMAKGGWWTGLAKNSQEEVKPGGKAQIVYGAFFGCNVQRRYQIHTVRGGSDRMAIFPSASGFTADTTPTIVISD